MNLVNIDTIFENFESEVSLDKAENKSYANYLLEIAESIPDTWKPHEKRHSSDRVFSIKFKRLAPKIELYIKAFALDLHIFKGRESETTAVVVNTIYRFLSSIPDPSIIDINTNLETAVLEYISTLQQRVKNKVIDKDENSITPQTARQDALSLISFNIFMQYYSSIHNWASNLEVSTILPTKLAKYFSKNELQIFKNELVELLRDNKTESIPWAMLHDIMEFVEQLPASHIKTAIIIMAEAGLRISEVRTLTIDCLEPVTDPEIKAVAKYLKRVGKNVPVELDYSKSYWLNYHITKNKGGNITKGTPILVGESVKHTIGELIELTADLRDESKNNMLFLNKNNKKITVRSASALRKDRDKLIKKGMPYFRFHQFRATFATILNRLGVPLAMIEKYLNHMYSDVTNGYINSRRKENTTIFNKILNDSIGGGANNEAFLQYQKELLSILETVEFIGLSYNSQHKMLERLMQKHHIKLGSADHGTCVLPLEKECPNGYEGVNPCHTEDCECFLPDSDEESEDFFILSLAKTKNKEIELKKFAQEHGSVHVNFEQIDKAKKSLNNILTNIRSN